MCLMGFTNTSVGEQNGVPQQWRTLVVYYIIPTVINEIKTQTNPSGVRTEPSAILYYYYYYYCIIIFTRFRRYTYLDSYSVSPVFEGVVICKGVGGRGLEIVGEKITYYIIYLLEILIYYLYERSLNDVQFVFISQMRVVSESI